MVEKDMIFSCVFYIDVDEPCLFYGGFEWWRFTTLKKRPWILGFNLYKIIRFRDLIILLPLGCKLVSCKWIFKIKYNVDGFVARHKVCLVARGFTQIEGIDFNKTFSLVAWMELIWIVLTIIAIENLEVHQMDVKTIFLNGDLSKNIYYKNIFFYWYI
jgi:hypothetical protein